MEDVPALLKDRIFDGMFSNFGALNCAQDLSSLLPAISGRIVAGGPLVAVIMGRYVPWEWIWYLFRADPRRSLRRLRRDGVPWRGVRITYPTPGETAAMLRPSFEVTRLSPLGCVLPPTYAAGWLNRSPRTLGLLTRLERLAQGSPLLARISDHFIVEAVNSPLH
jgi:hypothetical protein